MKHPYILTLVLWLAIWSTATGQLPTYFPPHGSSQWDTITPASLQWSPTAIDSLYDYLAAQNTKAFILLKDGKIVLERYFDGHSASDNWYWASAGKTLTAALVGIAQQQQLLDIQDPTQQYLGAGWTDCTPAQEQAITLWHQLTMTTGLDDSGNLDCTADTCLLYLAPPGTRWSYHNAPYTLLIDVLEQATNQPINAFAGQQLLQPLGMNGTFLPVGDNTSFFSNARSMARFGLWVLNRGNWAGNILMSDTSYFNAMTTSSQALNLAYGYLWWLNGASTYMIPGVPFPLPGSISPHAPSDMIAALGKNGQCINVVPSQNLVWIRMGDAPSNDLVPFLLNDGIWERLQAVMQGGLSANAPTPASSSSPLWVEVFPNPATTTLQLRLSHSALRWRIIGSDGQLLDTGYFQGQLETAFDVSRYPMGIYWLTVEDELGRVISQPWIKR